MSALVTRVWTGELATTKWTATAAPADQALEEHGVEQVSISTEGYNFFIALQDITQQFPWVSSICKLNKFV